MDVHALTNVLEIRKHPTRQLVSERVGDRRKLSQTIRTIGDRRTMSDPLKHQYTCIKILEEPKTSRNHSANLDQMQVHELLPPHEHLHRLTHSLWPGQVKKNNLWLKHLQETYEGVRIGII